MSTTTTAPFRRSTADRRARTAALLSGATGIAANVLLALFFALAEPFSGSPNGASWLGTANDWFMVPQFVALIPVAVALGGRLPATGWVRAQTVAGAVAMAVIVVAQLALVSGGTTAPPDPNAVTVANDVFSGGTKTVAVGTTVTWTWAQGAVTHNVTFDDGQHSASQNSGTYSRQFTTAGTYPYHCTIHGPSMSGTITVQ